MDGENETKIHRIRIKLSTIIEADNSRDKQQQLCTSINSRWKRGETIRPVIALDAPNATKWDLKIAGQFLDFFVQPWRGVCLDPEFEIVKGIPANYQAFFEEYNESYKFHRKRLFAGRHNA